MYIALLLKTAAKKNDLHSGLGLGQKSAKIPNILKYLAKFF